MATIQKRGTSYKITVSSGYDLSGKQIRHTMTWTPPDGMTNKQIQKEVHIIGQNVQKYAYFILIYAIYALLKVQLLKLLQLDLHR